MPSSPFSFESNTPQKSISPVPSPAGFKIMSSMHALQTTSKKKTKMEQQKTKYFEFILRWSRKCSKRSLYRFITRCFPYENENEETAYTEKDPLAVQVEQPKYLET